MNCFKCNYYRALTRTALKTWRGLFIFFWLLLNSFQFRTQNMILESFKISPNLEINNNLDKCVIQGWWICRKYFTHAQCPLPFDTAIVTDNIWEFQIHCKLTQHFQNFDFEHLKVFKIHHSGRVSLEGNFRNTSETCIVSKNIDTHVSN